MRAQYLVVRKILQVFFRNLLPHVDDIALAALDVGFTDGQLRVTFFERVNTRVRESFRGVRACARVREKKNVRIVGHSRSFS